MEAANQKRRVAGRATEMGGNEVIGIEKEVPGFGNGLKSFNGFDGKS